MKKTFNLFPLLLCLFYSTTEASPPSQKDFDFIKPFNDTTLVANGLELAGSIAGLSLSTLLNLGIWWGVCKTAGIVTGLSDTYDLAASDTKELEELKTDFCLQLAPVITTAEVALAGHVSSWPLEQHWWKLLYFAGAGMDIYTSMTETRKHIPVGVLTYLASEALLRTGASATSVSMLRNTRLVRVTTKRYVAGEYALLSVINGVMAGAVTYEALIHKGFRPERASLAAVVSAAIVGALSGIGSELIADVDEQTKAGVGFGVGIGAGAGALAGALTGAAAGFVSGAGIGAGIGAGCGAGTLAGILAGVASGSVVGAGVVAAVGVGLGGVTGALVGAEIGSGVGSGVGSGAGFGAALGSLFGILSGALAGAGVGIGARLGDGVGDDIGITVGFGFTAITLVGVGILLMSVASSKATSDDPCIKAGVTLVPALTFAVINSLSNYAVYGYPLEQSLSETVWTQWKKFNAPLDYLSILFK
ncbi:hypothetical protein [Endozoicomonas sp. 8E]|uniref:hypothetical protein n=1 Tax=Endozoicomonas sp. 8E TaxID=3035692 RepID=UPI002939244A|nr:hypothetical protein [Endozoicomonas sp. 8E]WOG27815.1 hypothetical protein P6910_25250 [Endozoicomonas sp. 8E]